MQKREVIGLTLSEAETLAQADGRQVIVAEEDGVRSNAYYTHLTTILTGNDVYVVVENGVISRLFGVGGHA